MVSPLTLGFFMPLPLAMMIPFMATQSLAMGEAFGKSFQYGKRKISSMTNEEFNKYTVSDMMDEQTANYTMLIPKLHEQMEASRTMQSDIFREMIQIIPAFMETMLKIWKEGLDSAGFNDDQTLPFGKIKIPAPDIVQASHDAPPTILELVEKTDDDDEVSTQFKLQFTRATEEQSFADLESNFNNISKFPNWQKSIIAATYNKRKQDIEDVPQVSHVTQTTSQEDEYVKWNTGLTSVISLSLEAKNNLISQTTQVANNAYGSRNQEVLNKAKSRHNNAQKAVLNYLTHGRNSSNHIIKQQANSHYGQRLWTKV